MNIRTLRTLLCSLVVASVVAVSATPASAAWGGGECNHIGPHCYAKTEWVMTHSGESVKGAEGIPETWSMSVPEWELGAWVDDEMWVAFQPSLGWLEIGQTAGGEHSGWSCCALHPFIAHAAETVKGLVYGYEEYTWVNVFAESRNLYRIEDPGLNGTWCEYIWNNQVDCKYGPGYWNTYATILQAGIEAATNTHPLNSGAQEVDYIAHGGEHRSWGGASPVTGYVNPGPYNRHELCLSPNPKSNYPGNADWSTC
jgi:hypothetical protein